jgi:hypothetical protein
LIREYAWDYVAAKMKAANLSFDKETKKVSMGGQAFTRAELIDRAIARDGETFRKAAEAEMKRLARLEDKAKQEMNGGATDSAEALGL